MIRRSATRNKRFHFRIGVMVILRNIKRLVNMNEMVHVGVDSL